MMANGTSGDINNINFREPRPSQPPYGKMRRVAEDVAGKVHAALAKAEYRDDVTLAARYREPMIASRRPTAEQTGLGEADAGRSRSARSPTSPPRPTCRRSTPAGRCGWPQSPETTPVPLQVFRIGPVCIGTMPTEVFCEIGLEFKKRSPIQPAFLVSLTHGYFGYLPTPRHFALGGYETWIGTNRLEPQASEKMLDTLLEMAAEVKE